MEPLQHMTTALICQLPLHKTPHANPGRRGFSGWMHIVAVMLIGILGPATVARGAEKSASLVIEIQPGDWGHASVENIRAVLKSAGGEVWKHCRNSHVDRIRVRRSDSSPITYFHRDKDGAVLVGLNTKDLYWAQYAYQFAHEFAHVLADHAGDAKRKWHTTDGANKWFEETLCETASLFALRSMARAWATNPPYPNWKGFAPKLHDYAEKLLQDPARTLPAGRDFSAWFRETEPSLRTNATQRARNGLMAARLLPFFEQEPQHWEAMVWLNLGTRDASLPFPRYLAEWRDACPPEHRPFVAKLATQFGIHLP